MHMGARRATTHNHVSQLSKERVENWLKKRRADTTCRFNAALDRMHESVSPYVERADARRASSNQPQRTAALLATVALPAAREAFEMGRRAVRNALAAGDTQALVVIRRRLIEVATLLKLIAPNSSMGARLYRDTVAFMRETGLAANEHAQAAATEPARPKSLFAGALRS